MCNKVLFAPVVDFRISGSSWSKIKLKYWGVTRCCKGSKRGGQKSTQQQGDP